MIKRETWWDDANCRGRHDLLARFVPNLTQSRQYRAPVEPELARLCATCPVKKQCYADGYFDLYAVRGGTTAAARQRDRKQRRASDVRAG